MSEQQGWTYTSDAGTYDVGRFTDEGKSAFVLIIETDKEIQQARKTLAKLEMAAQGFNAAVLQQLTDDMLVEEEATEEPVQSDSHEI
tara:strand:+ start:399 stop:659 length:261 start_codon:yes stop_codon:yes gene_type:complete